MLFPDPVLLITFDVHADQIDVGCEGTLVEPVEVFDTAALRPQYQLAIVCWSSVYETRAHFNDADDHEQRARLIDWINSEVCPRLPGARKPIWL